MIFKTSKRTSPSCLGEFMLNGIPDCLNIDSRRKLIFFPIQLNILIMIFYLILIPLFSISDKTGINGISIS